MNSIKILALTAASGAALLGAPGPATAQSEPLIGQVSLFGTNFCPRGWLAADGAVLPIAQYSALFSLFGTTYGGDGRTTFALPDLRDRAPVGESRTNRLGSRSDTRGAGQPNASQGGVLAMRWCVAVQGVFPGRS
ncbi:hypothetical protein GCM10009116_23190 [Brevundimonas basaltis]|uniref:Microcystin-dependent protein n=1 Tax=Brevundimonas basaltis TaxID=472166 RepID=A0A7W8I1T8_9CAUL|nr:tail fiber protein [Brevundimonas basaltis]MBB5293035.1 microcystin-dependent protein [Brevundimonas basaltis]